MPCRRRTQSLTPKPRPSQAASRRSRPADVLKVRKEHMRGDELVVKQNKRKKKLHIQLKISAPTGLGKLVDEIKARPIPSIHSLRRCLNA